MSTVSEKAPTLESESNRIWTYRELCAQFPETNQPVELWDGKIIMSPAPSFFHQEIVLRFYEVLVQFVRKHQLGKVTTAPVDMILSEHRVVQPDVAFISRERLNIIQDAIHGPVDLAVEVVSLGGRQRDRIEKKDLYEQYGVKEYWLIDPEAGTVEVFSWNKGVYTLAGQYRSGETAASEILKGFEIAVDAILIPPPKSGKK